MALYDTFFYDQKWGLWDTWKSFGRNVRGYVITASYKLGRAITGSYNRGNAITGSKSRGNIITGV